MRGPYFEVNNNHAAPQEPFTLAKVKEAVDKLQSMGILKDQEFYTPDELCFRREYLGSFEEGEGQLFKRDKFTWNMSKPSPSYGLPVIFHEEKDLAPSVKVKYKEHPKGSAKWRRNKRRSMRDVRRADSPHRKAPK